MKTFLIGLCTFMTTFGMLASAANALSDSQTNSSTPNKVVILLGPPGSGKGTQAIRLSKELNIPHISTGDLFRENMSKGTALGNKAKEYIEAGKLVPNEIVVDMLMDRVSQPNAAKGYLLDGFPRTIPQAEEFDKHLSKQTKLIVFNLDVDDAELMKRIAGRLQASGNAQRADDRPEVVQERLNVYHAQTKPLIDYYQKKGLLITIDGKKTPDEVYNDIISAYKSQ